MCKETSSTMSDIVDLNSDKHPDHYITIIK